MASGYLVLKGGARTLDLDDLPAPVAVLPTQAAANARAAALGTDYRAHVGRVDVPNSATGLSNETWRFNHVDETFRRRRLTDHSAADQAAAYRKQATSIAGRVERGIAGHWSLVSATNAATILQWARSWPAALWSEAGKLADGDADALGANRLHRLAEAARAELPTPERIAWALYHFDSTAWSGYLLADPCRLHQMQTDGTGEAFTFAADDTLLSWTAVEWNALINATYEAVVSAGLADSGPRSLSDWPHGGGEGVLERSPE